MARARARRSAAILAELRGSATSARFVDLAVSIRLCDVAGEGEHARWITSTDEELVFLGGRWDRRRKRWTDDEPTSVLVLRLHRGQEEAARWLAEWLRRYGTGDWEGFARVWTCLLIGGRRASKTHLALVALIAFCILMPKAIVWTVSPTLESGNELDQALRELLPRSWYARREATTGSALIYSLPNGTKIHLRSGAKTAGLRAGRADFCLLNESQLQAHGAFVNLRGAVVDRSGLVVCCANPPDSPRGKWVATLFDDVQIGAVDAVAYQLDPRRNPFIDYRALAALEKEVDAQTFARDVLGHFTAIGDVVFYAWSDESWRDPPSDLVDITAEVTKRKLGVTASFVVGMDFQKQPAMVAVVLKLFRDPDDEDEIIAWVVDEFIIEHATENELIDAIERAPAWAGMGELELRDPSAPRYDPRTCVVIADASGWWQDGAHNHGRTSDRALLARRWKHLFKPQADSDKNPIIVERVKATNARLKSASGARRLFVARHCTWTAEALRAYPMRNGAPDRRHELAHVADAISYPVYRLFGRPSISRAKPPRYVGIGREMWTRSGNRAELARAGSDRDWGANGDRRGGW